MRGAGYFLIFLEAISGQNRLIKFGLDGEKKSSSYLAVIKGLTDAQIEFAEGEFTLNDLGTNRALDPSKDIVAFDVGVIPMTDLQIAIDRDQ